MSSATMGSVGHGRTGLRESRKTTPRLVFVAGFRPDSGRGDWIRTSGPLHPMQVRYQTAPLPDARKHSTGYGPLQDEPAGLSIPGIGPHGQWSQASDHSMAVG